MRHWRDALHAARDRLVANPAFQRFAAGFPLTRPVAQSQASALFDITAGFVYAQILAACVRLDLFAKLQPGPLSAAELAPRIGLDASATERLLSAAASLRLTARRGSRYGLGMLGAAMLGNPAAARMVEHHRAFYADLADPVALLRGERKDSALAAFWPYAEADAESVAPYSALMAASQPLLAEDVMEAVPFARHGAIMDVGGGDGTFLLSLAARIPEARLTLVDLPPVAARARAKIAQAGRADRISVFGGDMIAGPLPDGADAVTLLRVLHDHDDGDALRLLRAIRSAIVPAGTLYIAEPMSGTRMSDAYFAFYFLAMGQGRARSPVEIAALLRDAGFAAPQELRTRRPFFARILATRPLSTASVHSN